jgi:hypothetical protein
MTGKIYIRCPWLVFQPLNSASRVRVRIAHMHVMCANTPPRCKHGGHSSSTDSAEAKIAAQMFEVFSRKRLREYIRQVILGFDIMKLQLPNFNLLPN